MVARYTVWLLGGTEVLDTSSHTRVFGLGFFLKGMVFWARQGWGQRASVNTISTGSGAGGSRSATKPLSSIIMGALWVVVGGELEFQVVTLSATVGGSGARAEDTASCLQGSWVCTSDCGLLVIVVSGCRWGAFSSWSSSWENCWLAVSSSPMTQINSGPPAGTVRLSSSSMLQVRMMLAALAWVLVEGPYLSWNLANSRKNLSKPTLILFHSCKEASLGAVSVGCGCWMSSSTLLMTVALKRGEEVLVWLPLRNFEGSLLLLWSCQTFEFDVIDASLVEGGITMFCACGGCRGEVGEAVEVVMVIMTSDGIPTFSPRSLSTGEIIFDVRWRSTRIFLGVFDFYKL